MASENEGALIRPKCRIFRKIFVSPVLIEDGFHLLRGRILNQCNEPKHHRAPLPTPKDGDSQSSANSCMSIPLFFGGPRTFSILVGMSDARIQVVFPGHGRDWCFHWKKTYSDFRGMHCLDWCAIVFSLVHHLSSFDRRTHNRALLAQMLAPSRGVVVGVWRWVARKPHP